MTWKELNWFQFEGSIFADELKGPFSGIFALTEAEFQKSKEQRDKDISGQEDNEHVHDELAWSDETLRKQTQILTAMIFTVTFRSIQTVLNEMLYWSTGNNPDLERLDRIETEYQKIGITLSDQKEFDLVKELRVARNSCVHNMNKPDDEYNRDYPKPRWVNDTGHISITKSQWNDLVTQLEQWSNELVKRLSKLPAKRPGHA